MSDLEDERPKVETDGRWARRMQEKYGMLIY